MTLFDGRLNEDAEYVQTVFDSQYSKTLKATWPLKHVKPSQLLTYKTEAFLNSRYELRKNVMTGVAQYRSKDSFDYRFSDLTKEVMNTMSIRALKAGLDSWDKDIKRYVESTMIPEFDPALIGPATSISGCSRWWPTGRASTATTATPSCRC